MIDLLERAVAERNMWKIIAKESETQFQGLVQINYQLVQQLLEATKTLNELRQRTQAERR